MLAAAAGLSPGIPFYQPMNHKAQNVAKSKERRMKKKAAPKPGPICNQEMKPTVNDPEFLKKLAQVEDVFKGWSEKERSEALFVLFQKYLPETATKFELVDRMEQTMRMNPLDFLPPEICIYVFSYLPRKDLAKCAQVSIQWRALAYDRSLALQKIQHGFMYCSYCSVLIAKETDVLSKKYRLDCSLAYHVSEVHNVEMGAVSKDVEHSIGTFDICNVNCRNCKRELGIKYVKNQEPENGFAVGTFLIKKKSLLVPGEPQEVLEIACNRCGTDFAKGHDVISSNYRLRGGDAYQFASLCNVRLKEAENVSYSSGNYTVAETFCAQCEEVVGVKYIQAEDPQNGVKVGSFLVEKSKVKMVFKTVSPPRKNSNPEPRKRSGSLLSSLMSFLST